MHILITGSSGFVGAHLTAQLLDLGHTVTGVDRSSGMFHHEKFEYVQADTTSSGPWQEAVAEAQVIINLAGVNIFRRWTRAYKQLIYDSRIMTTRRVVEALPADASGITLCNTSAVGYYGDGGDTVLTEPGTPGDDFLARVCVAWEREAFEAGGKGARVAATRFGVVMGPGGGALSKMIPAFRLFAGGPLGSGNQWFPWIHIDDLVAAMVFVATHEKVKGPVNFCAPNPVQNADFARTLGRVLNRPAFLKVPKFALKLAAGEVGGLILNSQRAVPEKLMANGFAFRYPELEPALWASV